MREQVRDKGRLEHILQAIDKVFEFTKDVKREDFTHPDTNWKVIVAMRHFLVHGYYQVDPEEVWNVIEQDLLPLKEQVEKYLAEME